MSYTLPDFKLDLQKDFFLIAGPCVIESRDHVLFMAKELKKVAAECGISFVFKASFDKANRSSIQSFRGAGITDGLKILAEVRKEIGVPVLTDIHEAGHADVVAKVVDVLQVP